MPFTIYLLLVRTHGIILLWYLLMGDALGAATYIDRLLVPSALSTTIFTLIGDNYFWSSYIAQKISVKNLKNATFEGSRVYQRDRGGFSNCLDLHMHYCATVSASNFQVLIYSG